MTEKAFNRFSVGLTGGIGSGKSAVADLLAQQGAAIIDTDQIAHALTAPGGAAIRPIAEQFGDSFLTPEGALDRAAMRERVFSDAAAKRQLEAILHPLIRQQTRIEAERVPGSYLVFVVPLLVESGRWKDSVDRVLVVDCSEALQLERVMRRSQLSALEETATTLLFLVVILLLEESSHFRFLPKILLNSHAARGLCCCGCGQREIQSI